MFYCLYVICALLQQYGFNMDSLQKKYGGSRAPGFVYGENTLCKSVCVCPPLDKGFSTNYGRGQRDLQSWPLPTKLHTGRSGKRTCAVIPLHSSLLCFDAMVVHVSPPKPFPPQQRCSLSRFVTAVKGNNFCSNTYNFLGLFAMLFHRHPSQRGN